MSRAPRVTRPVLIVAAVGATGLVLLAAWTAAVIDAVLAIWEDGP